MMNKKIFFILILTTAVFSTGKVGTAVYRWAEAEPGNARPTADLGGCGHSHVRRRRALRFGDIRIGAVGGNLCRRARLRAIHADCLWPQFFEHGLRS